MSRAHKLVNIQLRVARDVAERLERLEQATSQVPALRVLKEGDGYLVLGGEPEASVHADDYNEALWLWAAACEEFVPGVPVDEVIPPWRGRIILRRRASADPPPST